MRPTANVFRFEQAGEAGIPFPSLADALRYAPEHVEATIRTSVEGVVLAEVRECGGRGGWLRWALTVAGQNVEDAAWTSTAPTLSPSEYDTVLALALAEEFASDRRDFADEYARGAEAEFGKAS